MRDSGEKVQQKKKRTEGRGLVMGELSGGDFGGGQRKNGGFTLEGGIGSITEYFSLRKDVYSSTYYMTGGRKI